MGTIGLSPCWSCGHLLGPPLPALRAQRQQSSHPASTSFKAQPWERAYSSVQASTLSKGYGSGHSQGLVLLRRRRDELRTRRVSGAGCRRVECSAGGERGPEDNNDKEERKSAVATVTEKTETEKDSKKEETQKPSASRLENMMREEEKVVLDAISVLELLGPEKVDPEDVKLLKEKVFGYTTYWVTGQESFGEMNEGVLLLGNLRGKREEVFAKVQKGMRDVLGNKYDMFMIEEPNAEEKDPRGGPRVSFLLLRKEISQAGPTPLWQYIIAFILFVLTAGACLELGLASQVSRLPPEVVSYFTSPNPDELEPPALATLLPYVDAALPLAYGVMGVQLFHEIGHRLVAATRKVKLGIPFLVPNITLGSFGSVTEFKSICADRATKFDVAMAGPLAGGGLSLAMFFVGLALSVAPEAKEDLVQVPSVLFQGSLLLGTICRNVLGFEAMHAANVAIHPLVVAGWCGITTTAFNLLPVGCLDGGRAMQAAFGKTAHQASSLITYLLLGLGLLGGPLSLPWGLYILIVQRPAEKPSLNDVTSVGGWRQGAYAFSIALVILMLLPIWQQLAEELGIGVTPIPYF